MKNKIFKLELEQNDEGIYTTLSYLVTAPHAYAVTLYAKRMISDWWPDQTTWNSDMEMAEKDDDSANISISSITEVTQIGVPSLDRYGRYSTLATIQYTIKEQ